MRIGASLLLIAVGAILRFAVTVHTTHGFNVHTAGVIVIVVGVVGLLISLMWLGTRRRTDVIQTTPAYVDQYGTSAAGGTTRTSYVEPRGYDPTV